MEYFIQKQLCNDLDTNQIFKVQRCELYCLLQDSANPTQIMVHVISLIINDST